MESKRTARVMITKKCHKACSYCCNNYTDTMKDQLDMMDRKGLLKYDEVMITGGEPQLYPSELLELVEYLNSRGKKVFLYTTKWTVRSEVLLDYLEGVHFTLHHPLAEGDLGMFYSFQCDIKGREGSYRAYIDPNINVPIVFNPSVFSRVESKPWMADGECPVPEDDLIYLREIDG